MPYQTSIIFISYTTTVNTFAVLLNFCIIVMLVRFRNSLLAVNNNKFLFSMAVSDLLVGIFGITGGTLIYIRVNQGNASVSLSIVKLCGLLPLFGSFFTSILSLSILTADRLIAVVYALRYHSIMTDARANFLVCLTWFTVSIILIIQGGIYFGISVDTELKVRTYEFAAFFILTSIVLCTANAMLYFIVRRKRKDVSRLGAQNIPGNTTLHRNLVKIFSDSKICIWMTIVFIICWLPMIVWYIGWDPSRLTTVFTICMSLSTSNSFLNPIIYLLKRKNFRKRFWKAICYCRQMKS